MPEAARTPEQAAHEAAMVQKVDDLSASLASQVAAQETPPAAQVAARPDDVPEQFWDAEKGQINQEALLAAYKASTAGKREEPKADEQPPEETPPVDEAAKAAEEAAKAAKLDMGALRAEVDSNGDLSPESYAALEKAGFDKATVSDFIEGQKARVQLIVTEAYTLAGGEEAYKAMTQWGVKNVSPEDLAAYDTAMSGTAAQRKQAITALKAQYEAAVGKDPSLVSGASAGQSEDKPFASRAEVTQAMRDPRYADDPAYRAMVMRRLDAMDTF